MITGPPCLSDADAVKSDGVADPPPDVPRPDAASVAVNFVGETIELTVRVPLYALTPTCAITTTSPTPRLWGCVVVKVAVVPASVAPAGDGTIVDSRLPGLITQLIGTPFCSSL